MLPTKYNAKDLDGKTLKLSYSEDSGYWVLAGVDDSGNMFVLDDSSLQGFVVDNELWSKAPTAVDGTKADRVVCRWAWSHANFTGVPDLYTFHRPKQKRRRTDEQLIKAIGDKLDLSPNAVDILCRIVAKETPEQIAKDYGVELEVEGD